MRTNSGQQTNDSTDQKDKTITENALLTFTLCLDCLKVKHHASHTSDHIQLNRSYIPLSWMMVVQTRLQKTHLFDRAGKQMTMIHHDEEWKYVYSALFFLQINNCNLLFKLLLSIYWIALRNVNQIVKRWYDFSHCSNTALWPYSNKGTGKLYLT